jgi:putative membrane protein
VTTLVVCVDRSNAVGQTTGRSTPVVGADAVEALVTEVGVADPEDASVNCILEALRVARDLETEGDDSVVAVVSGAADAAVGADRSIARDVDAVIEDCDPDAAVVVVDSPRDERLVPIVESRVRVDSVDRVVVRQDRDIESTYYRLKQFLADEELRQTVLVPLGVALVVFPVLSFLTRTAVAVATITAVTGLFLLYKGFGVDAAAVDLAAQARDAVYSGRVSLVTYAVAGGLTLVGTFAGATSVSGLDRVALDGSLLLQVMAFAHGSVPWVAVAALTASLGRLLDEAIGSGELTSAYLNLPFLAVAIGLVVRGFSGWFLERGERLAPLTLPRVQVGSLSVAPAALTPIERLAAYVVVALAVALLGARVASYLSGTPIEETDLADADTDTGRER